MTECTYDGWSNYETWAVAIWLDTDQSSHLYWRQQARKHSEISPQCEQVVDGTWTPENATKYNLADQLKEEISGNAPEVFSGAYSDLLHSALTEVNWEEIAAHYIEKEKEALSPFGPVIFAYTRAQAIADGVLIDVSEMAREAGLKHPTAVTAAVWADYVAVPDGVEAQDEQGRLWDILVMLRFAIQKGTEGSELLYELLVRNDNKSPRLVQLKAVCGPGDSAEPVLTIMLPHED